MQGKKDRVVMDRSLAKEILRGVDQLRSDNKHLIEVCRKVHAHLASYEPTDTAALGLIEDGLGLCGLEVHEPKRSSRQRRSNG